MLSRIYSPIYRVFVNDVLEFLLEKKTGYRLEMHLNLVYFAGNQQGRVSITSLTNHTVHSMWSVNDGAVDTRVAAAWAVSLVQSFHFAGNSPRQVSSGF